MRTYFSALDSKRFFIWVFLFSGFLSLAMPGVQARRPGRKASLEPVGKVGPLVPTPKRLQPAPIPPSPLPIIQDATYTFTSAYYRVHPSLQTTLLLNNKSPNPLTVNPKLFEECAEFGDQIFLGSKQYWAFSVSSFFESRFVRP